MTLSVAYNITYATVTSPSDPSPWAPLPEISTDAIFLAFLLQVIVLSSTYLLAGWIADMVIGRDKAIIVSFSSCWFATLLQISSYVVQYNTFGQSVSIAKYGVSSIALVLITIGTVLFFSIFLAYGMDQLLYEPSATMRAFIHWIAWGMSMGHTVSYLAFFQGSILYDPPIIIGSTVCVFGILTMALVLHICLKDKFLSNNKLKDNPYTMAVRILLYAYRHKFPQNRSAFGQWEHDKPGRVDLAKWYYGGPFMNDSVENTKSIWKDPISASCIIMSNKHHFSTCEAFNFSEFEKKPIECQPLICDTVFSEDISNGTYLIGGGKAVLSKIRTYIQSLLPFL